MSVSYEAQASPPVSPPPLASAPSSRSPVERGQRRRASTAESSTSTASTAQRSQYHQSNPSDPFASAPATWYTPRSPGSSTFSGDREDEGGGAGSPRSYYSAAAAPASTSDAGHIGAQHTVQKPISTTRLYDDVSLDTENDIGDVTITDGFGATPRRWPSSSRKGKNRADHLDQYVETASYDASQYHQGPEDIDAGGQDEDESKRVEENLKRWAAKEKLRRQKTRSRTIPVQRASSGHEDSSDAFATMAQLVRRMSTVGRSVTTIRPQHHRKGSSRLQSIDSKNYSTSGVSSPFGDVEEVELQTQSQQRSHPLRGTSADSYGSIISPEEPSSATSQNFPERVQRAARTGSRFIEDLEDQEILHSIIPGQGQAQSYAQLISPPVTPAGSPSKPKATPASRKRPFLRITDPRASSILSFDSQNPDSPQRPNPYRQSSGNTTPTLQSPTHSFAKPYYEDNADNAAARLVPRLRGSDQYPRQNSLDDEYDSDNEVGWLQWILCCGCCSNLLKGPDDEEQAGRTFPE